jgi:hypothetical protein
LAKECGGNFATFPLAEPLLWLPLPLAPPEPTLPDLLELALRLDFTDPLPAGLEVLLLSLRRPPPAPPVPEVAMRTSSAEAAGRVALLRGPLGVVPLRKAPLLPPRALRAELAVESPSLEDDR